MATWSFFGLEVLKRPLLLWGEKPQLNGANCCLNAVGNLELLDKVAYVNLDGAHANQQLLSDLSVGMPSRQELQNLNLARCKRFGK